MPDASPSDPIELRLNACWFDVDEAEAAAASGKLAGTALRWMVTNPVADRQHLAPPQPADYSNWTDSRVGWGVILPEQSDASPGAAEDLGGAPEAIKRLIADRKAKQGSVPVFRYDKAWEYRYSLLRSRSRSQPQAISATTYGLGDREIPYYLLICGTPEQIPWEFQYILNATHAVGRLDLDEEGLSRYVDALIAGWAGSEAKPSADRARALVWAVDHSVTDITHLMREAIARPLYEKYSSDADMKADLLAGADAGGGALIQKLAEVRPGLVVTTSHGRTAPTAEDKQQEMRDTLGIPVDRDLRALDLAKLLARWDPYGSIWYAHACCSAGGDGLDRFDGVIADGSSAKAVLKAVARLGPVSAPLPRKLLGGERPARAFVGHVEPTFDWTLQHPLTRQQLTGELVRALYDNLYLHQPIGHALKAWFRPLGGLRETYEFEKSRLLDLPTARGALLYASLAAKDVESTVILGDPTATL
ncbi:hypothetical protein, partial [Paludisphaera rhizosphaerae]|uniref:hypothetical protein n=1 Tax=Paludisphaera rhizosphaerae TaxID=2711216 RepID=UPI0013ED6165